MEDFLSASSPVANMLRHLHKSTKALTEAQTAGGSGHSEPYKVSFPLAETSDTTLTVMGHYVFSWYSPMTPSKAELTAGNIFTVSADGAITKTPFTESFSVDGLCVGALDRDGNAPILFAVAYKAGTYTVTDNNLTDTIEVAKPGIYCFPTPDRAQETLVLEWETVHPIDPKFLPEGVGGASLPSPQINLMDYGVSLANLMSSTFTIPQSTDFWQKVLEVKATGLVPEVQVLSEGKGTTAYVAGWQYDAGVPTACACIGKTISGSNVVEIYMVLLYDATSGTVTVVHNMA